MSSFRAAARTTDPAGRLWEIYAYKLRLPERPHPDPGIDGPTVRLAALAGVLDGIVYVLAWIPRLLVRLLADVPLAAVRALRSDEWMIEAISWAPYPVRHRWSTTREFRGQVLASVEGQLARGERPVPRNARRL